MKKQHIGLHPNGLRHTSVRIFQTAALALLVTMAIPVSAADNRAVKSRTAPVYPEIAKRMRISGEVRLEVNVEAEFAQLGGNVFGGGLALYAATIRPDAIKATACEHNLTGQDLGGMTLVPGVYCFDSSVGLTGQLTLDGGGNSDAASRSVAESGRVYGLRIIPLSERFTRSTSAA